MNPIQTIVLPPLSLVYNAVTRARLSLYKRGILSVSRLDAPVISVGNITTGGTGKTPMVEWVSRTLANAGRKVCILTRGYGRKDSSSRVIVSDGKEIFATYHNAGDEPLLLAEKLKGLAAVISDRDRIGAGRWATKELGSDVFVLDDGFQHLGLFRDLNIVMIDATNPWGGGELLPYGRLREPLSSLRRADCVIVTRTEQGSGVNELNKRIRELCDGCTLISSFMKIAGLRSLDERDSGADILQPVGAFCGIGNPNSFFYGLAGNYRLAWKRSYADHHIYSQKEIDYFVNEAVHAGARTLITTAKDAVKLRSFIFQTPVFVLEISITFSEEAKLKTLIAKAVGIESL